MQYQSLTKLYYISPDEVAREYEKRFESPSAIHLPIEIKQYHRVKSYPAFFIYHNEMALIIDQFYKNYEEFYNIYFIGTQYLCLNQTTKYFNYGN